MVRTTSIGMVCCAAFTISGICVANEIAMSFETPGIFGRTISYSYDHTGSHTNPLLSGTTTAGRYDWTVISEGPVIFGGSVFNNGDQFSTFTAELTGFVTPGETYSYEAVKVEDMPGNADSSAMGAFRAGLLQDLFDNHYTESVNGSTLHAAAFQVAVWEIAYEDRLAEFGSGGGPPLSELLAADADTFVVSNDSAVVDLANTWLDELTGTVLNSKLIGFGSMAEALSPNQISMQSVIVPLPAPFWLAGIGLSAVVVARKKLRRLAGA